MDIPANMKVLLIGGSSGTGKSTLARALSQRWGIPALQVDDFRLLLHRVTQQAQQHGSRVAEVWNDLGIRPIIDTYEMFTSSTADPAQMAGSLMAVAGVMSDALEIVIAHHIATRVPIILEGDGLLPALAMRSPVDNLVPMPGELRAVFLVEDQEDNLFEHALQRGRGFDQGSPAEQRRIITANWLFGQWIKTEAQNHSLPVLAPRPWQTLLDRTLTALF
jgi:2-phosphoglycerate kinase